MSGFDVSVIVNAHREGLLAVPSLRSVERARLCAAEEGLSVETILVLDRADALTVEIMEEAAAASGSSVLRRIELGDLGRARNEGVRAATGRYVAFLDADDLWCESWLVQAMGCAARDPRPAIWHPEMNLYFGGRTGLYRHIDMENPDFEWESLLLENYWTSLCVVSREIALAHPYPATDLGRRIGFEDWGWNLATAGAGILHKIVPGTCHGVRVKTSSLLRMTNLADAMPRPSPEYLARMFAARRQDCSKPVVPSDIER